MSNASQVLAQIPDYIRQCISDVSNIPLDTDIGDMTNLNDAHYLTQKVAECNKHLNSLDNLASDIAMVKLNLSQLVSARKIEIRRRSRALLESNEFQEIQSPTHRENRLRELLRDDYDFVEDNQTYLRDFADIESIIKAKSGSYKRLVSILKTKLNSVSGYNRR